MKAITLPALLLLLTLLVAPAQSHGRPGGHQPGHSGPARPEVKAYVAQNVLPVLRLQRQKLEPQLSTADRAQLAIYRTQLQELRQRRQALRQSFRPVGTAPAAGRPELTDAQKQQLRQLRTDTKALLLSVEQIAQNYTADLTRLAQEVQPQQEQWSADLRALVQQHATPSAQPGRATGRASRSITGRLLRPAMFLLLDPNLAASSGHDLGAASVYPNPAVATSQLQYEVKKAGPVTIELLDGRGNTLRPVAQEARQEKGTHTVQVEVATLPAGTYFYKITTKSGSETRRFVKE